MNNKFYIPRTLFFDSKTYSEAELLASFEYIVVLAEPGAGKTDLLGSFAEQLDIKRISASLFRHSNEHYGKRLVLDAFDEVSRIDPSGIFELLIKAQATGVNKVVISSRFALASFLVKSQ